MAHSFTTVTLSIKLPAIFFSHRPGAKHLPVVTSPLLGATPPNNSSSLCACLLLPPPGVLIDFLPVFNLEMLTADWDSLP